MFKPSSILGSQLLEKASIKKMSNISHLLSWDMPQFARLIKKDKREMIPTHQIQTGMKLEVLPRDEKVPADGDLLDEQASLAKNSISNYGYQEYVVSKLARRMEKTEKSCLWSNAFLLRLELFESLGQFPIQCYSYHTSLCGYPFIKKML